jgi:hypothetical protein
MQDHWFGHRLERYGIKAAGLRLHKKGRISATFKAWTGTSRYRTWMRSTSWLLKPLYNDSDEDKSYLKAILKQ